MKTYTKLILSLFLTYNAFFITYSHCQNTYIDVSGVIKNSFNESLEGVLVKIKSKHLNAISDNKGMFNIVVQKGDIVRVSYPGYRNSEFNIPDTLVGMFYYMDIIMVQDTIVIDAVTLFPWKTYEEFKSAVLAYEPVKNKEINNALRNIALVQTQVILYNDPDPDKNFKYVMQQQIDKATNYGLMPSYSILNPFAWAAFFKALQDGLFKNSNDLPEPK